MQDKSLSIEAKLIFDVCQQVVLNEKNRAINLDERGEIDWPLLMQLIAYHELLPFAYIYFHSFEHIVPSKVMDFFKIRYYSTLLMNNYFREEFINLTEVFIKEDIAMLPIKGMALLGDIYNLESPRPMADIDILVKKQDLERAEGILIKCNYVKDFREGSELYWKNKNCNIPFKKNGRGRTVELHFALDLERFDMGALPKLWKRLRTINTNGTEIKLLSPEDTLFSLALHQRRFGKRLCLKNTLDIVLLIKKYKDNFDWDYVLKAARAGKARSTIFFALFQSKILLGTLIPDFVWESLRVSLLRKKLVVQLIKDNIFCVDSFHKIKYIYLKSHFLIYDNLWEPIRHILHITKEEFAKFYNLSLSAPDLERLYMVRFVYMPYSLIKDNFRKALLS